MNTLLIVLVFISFAVVFTAVNLMSWPDWFVKISYRPFWYWIPYVVLGIYLARNPHRSLPPYAATAGIVLVIVESVFFWKLPGFDADYVKPGLLIGSGLLVASYLNSGDPGEGVTSAWRKVFFLVGGGTMGIFVLNPLVLIAGQTLMSHFHWRGYTGPFESVAMSLFITVGSLVACLTATEALRRMRLGRLVS